MPTSSLGRVYKRLAAAVVLIGVAGVVIAQNSHPEPPATGIDFHRTETLEW
jgi:hypothetical protein